MVYYEDLKKKERLEKPQKKEVLPCATCPKRWGGECQGGSSSEGPHRMTMCSIAYEVTNIAWIELPLARKCKGPEHMRNLLMEDFKDERLVVEIAPPDS